MNVQLSVFGEVANEVARCRSEFTTVLEDLFGTKKAEALVEDFKYRVDKTGIEVSEIRKALWNLTNIDWVEVCATRDAKKEEEEEAIQNQIISCSRSDCQRRRARREMIRAKRETCGLYCPECARKTDAEYEPRCVICGEIVVVTRRLTKNVLCERCGRDYNQDPLLYYEKYRVERHNSRARELHREATLTLEEWLKILSKFKGKCAYCGGRYEVLEHYIPLSKGGGTTADNCFPSCHQCNVKKGSVIPTHSFDSRPAS